MKRAFDIVAALTGLLVLSPVLAAAALAILLTMGRPVLFRQVRAGYEGRSFEVIKFRTMRDELGPDGQRLAASERVTGVGWRLRRWSIDELPQLWNVLRGDLSLVGPRPLMPHYLPYYTEREQLRHSVRPGLTGLAQIAGRNHLTWDGKLELDAQYASSRSLRLDGLILIRTAAKLLGASDVSRDPLHEGDFAEIRRQQRSGPPERRSDP